MLAKMTSKNQLTLPKSVTQAVGAAQYFDVETRDGQIILTPVRIQRSDAVRDAAVVVNTTTLGMKGAGDPEVAFAAAHPDLVVSDIVYVPLETAFLAAARRSGLATVDGLGMLLHQAVPGFEKWFGVRPQVTAELYDLVRSDIEGRT